MGAAAEKLVFHPDDPEMLPDGAVIDGETFHGDADDVADWVVVGTGAAGAAAAVVLAESGGDVVLVEEGPWVRTREFGPTVYPALKRLFRAAGGDVVLGRAFMPLLQGRCVGGSTTVNSAIAWRLPEHLMAEWATVHGLGPWLNPRALEPHFEALERDLHVHAVDDAAFGENNGLFVRGARALGIASERTRRYDGGCQGTAGCLTGCHEGRKLGMNITYVPRTLHAGGRLYTSARVSAVDVVGGRAVGIRGNLAGGGRLQVRARRGVFVAASTVQTPGILQRSGVRSKHLGAHFQAHPGSSIAGLFDRDVAMDVGATQGANSVQFAQTDRLKLESISLPPELAAARLPGYGADFVHRLANYGHLVIWDVVVRAEAEGTVRPTGAMDMVRYSPLPRDVARVRRGLRLLTEMMFAAGAREVYPSIHGLPQVMRGPGEATQWDALPDDARCYPMIATHLFGAARMAVEPHGGVVGTDFQVHGARGLYVVDSSVFPTNIGVNPQHTIMALARLAAARAVGG